MTEKEFKNTIAIAYVTENGTTQRAAEKIAETLSARGLEVKVLRLSELTSPLEYGGLIFGTPIIGLRALPQFQLYLEEHQPELSNVLGLFAVSFIYGKGLRLWTKSIKNHVDNLGSLSMARSYRIFGRTLNKNLASIVKFIFGLPHDTQADQFHPQEVAKWAEEIAVMVRQT